MSTTQTIEILNDLVEINNDRITGYERALKELDGQDTDLLPVFTGFIGESHKIKMELATEITALNGEVEQGTTASGKIYRAWMDVKAVFSGHGRHAVLENCEAGEDAAQRAYKSALADESLTGFVREMVSQQQLALKASHDKIKALRDIAEVHA